MPGFRALEVRQVYLKHGGEMAETGRALGIKRQSVADHVRRANLLAPIRIRVTLEADIDEGDAEAVKVYIMKCAERAGFIIEGLD